MKTVLIFLCFTFFSFNVHAKCSFNCSSVGGMNNKIKPRDITNMTMKASAYKGKKFKSYEIINKSAGPVIGSKSFKFTLMPYDCGYYKGGTDCGKIVKGGNGGRARSELTSSKFPFTEKNHER